jgi:hypothetical protein
MQTRTFAAPVTLTPFALGLMLLAFPLHAETKMEKTSYGGWPNSVRLSNGKLELIATTDVGPRVMHLAFPGGSNLFKVWPDQFGKSGGGDWRIYGGHRLWHGPEVKPRTYAPDNGPVKTDWDGRRLKLTQPVEELTGLQKEIEIALGEDASVAVVHRLINRSQWDIEAAPWALTVCQGPGRAIVPQEPYVAHADKVLAARSVTLWGYTDMADSRYVWGTKFVQLRSDPAVSKSQKVGFMNTVGWAAFNRGDEVLVKRFAFNPHATYADFGCNTEIYTSGDMLELETLGPLGKIAPGAGVEHVERWYLFRATLGADDAALATGFAPLLRQTETLKP